MEIIHLILGKANPERMNGVNKVVYQLATEQAAFGEQVSIWGITEHVEVNFGKRNFETRLFVKQKNPFRYSNELQKAIIAKKGKAIFHLHGGWIPVYYSLAGLLHKHAINFVLTPHGAYNSIAMEKNGPVKKIYFRLFEKSVLEKAAQIHCIGASEIKGLNTIFRKDKTLLLPYGYRKNENTVVESVAHPEIIFGFIGRLDVYTKGLDTLLQAFQKFNLRYPKSQLWIIGESTQRNLLEKQVDAFSLRNNVVLYGSKFGKEKEALLKRMDVFVHPSRNEGLPVAVLEAASFGKPCLVTQATNIAAVVEQYGSGKTIDTQSDEILSDAMITLYETWRKPAVFKQMQINAVKMVEETYNWDKLLVRFHTDLYQM